MAISFTKEEEGKKKKTQITTRLFWTLVFVLILVFFIFGILKLYIKILDTQIKNKRLKIQEMNSKIDTKLESEMKNTLSNYEKVYPLFTNHLNPRKTLDFLERNRHPKVHFSSIQYEKNTRSVTLTVSSEAPIFIESQINIFKKQIGITLESVEHTGVNYSGKEISTQLKIIFKREAIIF